MNSPDPRKLRSFIVPAMVGLLACVATPAWAVSAYNFQSIAKFPSSAFPDCGSFAFPCIDDAQDFLDHSPALSRDGQQRLVLFQSGTPDGHGIFIAGSSDPLRTVVTDFDGVFSSVRRPAISENTGVVGFLGHPTSGAAGLFTVDTLGTFTTIATIGMSVPGAGTITGIEDDFAGDVADDGTVAFAVRFDSGVDAIVTGSGGPLTVVAEDDTSGPLPPTILFPGPLLNNNGQVAITGHFFFLSPEKGLSGHPETPSSFPKPSMGCHASRTCR